MAKRKRTKVQNITQKSKDRVTGAQGELMCFGRVSSSCSKCDTCRVALVTNPVISDE